MREIMMFGLDAPTAPVRPPASQVAREQTVSLGAPRGVCRLEEGQAEDSECPQCAPLASLRLEVWIC